jgi:hypothetical protein
MFKKLKAWRSREKAIKGIEEDVTGAIMHNAIRGVFHDIIGVFAGGVARELYDKGYEKRSQAEWLDAEEYYVCSNCNHDDEYMTNYCSECGAAMKARR